MNSAARRLAARQQRRALLIRAAWLTVAYIGTLLALCAVGPSGLSHLWEILQ